jgi:methylmalonyl-CoA mutase N-terminal domain/subunit
VAVKETLAALSHSAEGSDNLMPRLIDCANAYCSVGELVTTLKAVWGEFQQPVVF